MVGDHKSARALFERQGFHVEALLPDWVEDRNGNCRDLLLMAYDLRTSGRQGREVRHYPGGLSPRSLILKKSSSRTENNW
jgi:hypothetical protein